METGMEQDHRSRPPPPTPSPTPSGSSGSSSEVVDAEWVEVEAEAVGSKRAQAKPARLAVVRVARGSGSRARPPRRLPVLARARCVVCAGPAVATARLFSVAHVPLCQRCGTVGAFALRLLGGA